MSTSMKLAAGKSFPSLSLAKVGGGDVQIGGTGGWQAVFVYRGKHCPLCKKYFATLGPMLDQFTASGVAVVAVSADPQEKAAADVAEHGWRFPVGYGLSIEQMRKLGLYVSEPRSPQETDRPFAEPALFVITPENNLQIIDISNAPFARPELGSVLMGIQFARDKGYPVRGTLL